MIAVISMLSMLSTFVWLFITQVRTDRHEPFSRRLATFAAAAFATAFGLFGIAAASHMDGLSFSVDAAVLVACVLYQLSSLFGAGIVWVNDSRVRV
jgi:hypothetical protein